jgi:Domain of unknown function (DUF4166)
MEVPRAIHSRCVVATPQVGSTAVPAFPRGARSRGVRGLLGEQAWRRLPRAVQQRFAEHAGAVDYIGSFDVVRASRLGKIIARVCQLIGTPVVPRTGCNVPATVRVVPAARGVRWLREYRWPGCRACTVRSTKVIDERGAMVEELPAFLCMSLDVFERDGVLHFVSNQYYFNLPLPVTTRRLRLALPVWLSPGTTHVEHIDEADGWFRFTMRTHHPRFGEIYYQTGRFRAAGGKP